MKALNRPSEVALQGGVDIAAALTKPQPFPAMMHVMEESISRRFIGAAVEVHRHLGPGLLESAYQACLAHELGLRGLGFEQQVRLPVIYKGVDLDCGYRMDFVVARTLIIEIKAQSGILPIHQAQLLTYLRLGGYRVGLFLNFQSNLMKDGILRVVL